MNIWNLPTSLNINGTEYEIRTDFRAILDILNIENNPQLISEDTSEWEKNYIRIKTALVIAFPEWETIPIENWEEAITKLYEFIDCGIKDDKAGKKPTLMSWEKDASILIPAINNVAHTEIRALPCLHWWTFLGYYMSIGESLFSEVIHIRQKKISGKKLEEWERKFYRENKSLIDLEKPRRSQQEQEELEKLFGIHNKNQEP